MTSSNHNTDPIELDDDLDTTPAAIKPTSALVAAALNAVDTRAVAKALAADAPCVVLIHAPTQQWAKAVAAEVGRIHADVATISAVESKRDGNGWATDLLRGYLAKGRNVIVCSQDPQGLLPPAILAAADIELRLPPITAKVVKRALERTSGQSPRGLRDADIAGLDLEDLALVLRDGKHPSETLSRFRRLAEVTRAGVRSTASASGPLLADLPLPADLEDWSNDCVQQLRAVASGELAAEQLRYAVLEGPPGTGKTLIAGAIARSAGWQFHSASIGQWFASSDGNLGGVSKACVRFFDELLANDHTIGFLDEIDALPDRQTLAPRDRQWWTPVINLLLTQIDRVRDTGKPVTLLAATNYHSRLDLALVRSSRLEQRISVRAPGTIEEIASIFAHYTKDLGTGSEAFLPMSRFALGATPADIASFVREARSTARRENRALTLDDIIGAVAPADTRSADEIEAVAIHEAGHAVVAHALGHAVESVSIIAGKGTGGYTAVSQPTSFLNRGEIEDQATVYLGGRAADMLVGKKGAHTGAAHDLEMATSLLSRAYGAWGLYDSLHHARSDDPEIARNVVGHLGTILVRAKVLVKRNRAQVVSLAQALIEKRLLQREEIEAVWRAAKIDAPTSTKSSRVNRPQNEAAVPVLASPTEEEVHHGKLA